VKSLLIRQAVVVPIAAMLLPILLAFTLPGYSSISQHISETELLHHPIAPIQRLCAGLTGASIILFGLGAVLAFGRRFLFTALAALLFGSSMISNGITVMGSPWHGLYGLGLFMSLVPAFFAAEAQATIGDQRVIRISMGCAVFNLAYMWLMIAGLDPPGYKGLTQRIATVVIMGWYTIAAYVLAKAVMAAPASKEAF
jgi:hypothetical protein